jgi:molybdopterin biosynthesis enzyme
MSLTQRLPASLTPLEMPLAALLRGLEPSTVVELPLREALGCVSAELLSLEAYPPHDVAAADGWALRAHDLVGASSYTPLPLTKSALWVEAGDQMPNGSDCVIDAVAVDQTGPIIQVLTEAIPGQGVRRSGGEFANGFVVAPGSCLGPLDLLVTRAAGLEKMKVRRPRLRVVNVPATKGEVTTAQLIQESARCAGAEVVFAEAASRDAASIAEMLDAASCELLVTIGGSGVGRTDATVVAMAQRGEVIAHGIALQPGRTSAIGRIGNTPATAVAGSADHALAAWWTLVRPALDRLSGRQPRRTTVLPLARKIASSVGIAEIALLGRKDDSWMPLALGDLPLETAVCADAWLMIPGRSEGFAAGTPVADRRYRGLWAGMTGSYRNNQCHASTYRLTDAGTFLLAECYGCASHTLIKDVDGLYDADPNTNPNANFIKEITVSELKERNLSTLPFDRVLIDLLACARQVKRFQIINGSKPNLLEPALRGEHVGTIGRQDAP